MVLAGWLWLDPSRAFEVSVAVLVVSCPCALSLAVPSALAAVQYQLAKAGVMLQGGDGLERLAQVTDLVLDKTGTLTLGRPKVCGLTIFDEAFSEQSALELAMPLLLASSHPRPFGAGCAGCSFRWFSDQARFDGFCTGSTASRSPAR
ncbi:MAG: cation-translocating P-type ATPase [Betaproteobacteria bacterium]|nr:cation-translocating P-type ATPase [Betaproteobacteria bacterium]